MTKHMINMISHNHTGASLEISFIVGHTVGTAVRLAAHSLRFERRLKVTGLEEFTI